MIELLYLSDLSKISHYPQAVIDTIRQSILNLDEAYGVDRSREGDGGLEYVIEREEELQPLLQSFPYGDLPESAEIIHRDFIHAIYILTNERSIGLTLPRKWATKQMMEDLNI